MNRRSIAAGATLLVLMGCSSQDDKDMNLADLDTSIINNAASNGDEGSATGNASAVNQSSSEANPAADDGKSIPAVIRGRWGMVPADCTSTHGDAKGLLEVSGDTLTFYESRGKLQTIKEHEASRIRAVFSFEGEGMNWQREMLLDVQDDNQTLIRREYGPEAMPGPARYRRCT